MIKNVIFDIGGVFVNVNPDEYFNTLDIEPKRREQFKNAFFQNPIFWRGFDNGDYDYDELKDVAISYLPEYEKEIEILYKNNWNYEIYHVVKDRVELFKVAKELSLNIYLLSNYSSDGYDYLENHNPFLKEVNGKVISGKVHLVKPDKEIYEYLIDEYNLNKEECLFIDDNIDNVNASNEIGIKSFLFINTKQAIYELKTLIK